MRIKTLCISIIFAFLLNVFCINVFAEIPKVREVVIEKPQRDVWIKKRYENGRLVEAIPYRWFSVKPKGERLEFHGNYKRFDKEGNIIKSRWYFRGQSVTADEFERLTQSVKFEPRLIVEETPLDKEAKEFIIQLSLAWQKRDYERCKDIIGKKLLEKPGWIPAIVAEYGYWTFIEHDDEKAVAALASIEDLVKEIVKRSNMDRSNTRLWKAFLLIYYNYYEQSKQGTGENIKTFFGKTVGIDKAHGTYVLFPPSDLMTAYFIASGVQVDMSVLRDTVAREEKKKK
jgi:hypothetical protein